MTTIIYGFLWIVGVALGCAFLMIAVVIACWLHLWVDDRYGEFLGWRFKRAKRRID